MRFHFNFSPRQILWTLTFASQLVLLVVMLGRDRARRYPWFTASIALSALGLMAGVLLAGRMAMLPFQEILLTLGDLLAIVTLLVVVEVARRAFAGVQRSLWIVNTTGLLVVAGGALAAWGPWQAWKNLALDTLLGKLKLMELVELKGERLAEMLLVGVGLLVVLFGRRFKAGWRSHTQMIAIGLSTVAIASLATQGAMQSIARTAHPNSRAEYDHIMSLLSTLGYAEKAVYLAALVWWIVWLWLDEPGAVAETAGAATKEKL
ncbi:MAG: hypothetical protein WCA89_12505 [Terracidiphilus sp.]|jgi:hypothetical protein